MRHSIETHLTNQNVNPRFIDFLQGHSQNGVGGNVYMKGVKPEVLLKECVEKINWDVDWKKLKVDWTISYDMKKSDGSFEYLELSFPKVFKDSNWKLPNQVGSWECSLSRFDKKIILIVGCLYIVFQKKMKIFI